MPASSSSQSSTPDDVQALDPTKHLSSRHAPADPGSPNSPYELDADKQAALARKAADQQVLQKLQDKYVEVHKTESAMFPYAGVCLRCGWHTLELSQDAAKALVNAHVAIHWRDVITGIQVQGGSGMLGVEGASAALRAEAMVAQEQGAVKGGQQALKPIEAKQKQLDQQMTQLAMQFSGTPSSGSPSGSHSGGD